jgi:hypothetical protein
MQKRISVLLEQGLRLAMDSFVGVCTANLNADTT